MTADNAKQTSAGVRVWLAVASIGIVTFAMVTTELLPTGLLSPIARDLGVSDGVGGLMVMTTGLVSALSAPLSMLVAGRTDRRVTAYKALGADPRIVTGSWALTGCTKLSLRGRSTAKRIRS